MTLLHRAVAAAGQGQDHLAAGATAQLIGHDAGGGSGRGGGSLLVLLLVLGRRRSRSLGSGGEHLHPNQIALGGLDRRVVQRLGLQRQVLIDLHHVVQTDGEGDLAGADVLGGANLGVGHVQRAGGVQGDHLVQHALDGGIGGLGAVEQLHHVAELEAVGVLQRQVCTVDGQDLGLGLAGGGHGDAHVLRPRAGVGGGDLQDARDNRAGLGIGGNSPHDVGPGTAVEEELLHRIGEEPGGAAGSLTEVAAEHPSVVGKAGDQLGLTHNRAALRQTHKACRAGADALHRGCTRIILLHVYTWGQIFCHVVASRHDWLGAGREAPLLS